MIVRNLSGLLLSLFTLAVLGCGGDGGGEPGAQAPVSTTLSGEASKGPVIGGDVKIYAINEDGVLQSTPLPTTPATVTTRLPFGNYSAVISYTGPVKVMVSNGSYMDEATGTTVDFTGKSLSAIVANVAGSARVSVTPYTELAVQKAGAALTPAKIKAANIAVANAMGLQDIDIIEASPSENSEYKFNLAVFSQAAGPDATAVTTLLTQMASAIDDSGAINDDVLKNRFEKAKTDAFNNVHINPDGGGIPGVDPATVSGVTVTASPSASAAISTTVIISATVKTVSGGLAEDGTVVTFAASAGLFSNVTTTASGVATATLSGISTPQTVSIKANVGNVKSSEININFTDPSSPSVITVSDVPGNHFINTPLTLTAVVKTTAGVAVPSDTPVTFEITPSVTGATLSASSSKTDASGNATVTLNSTTAGAVTVKITAAQATGSHTITFADPNKLGSIVLSANKAPGITNNNGPVILTATLTPLNLVNGSIADGTPVTFSILSGTGGILSSTVANTSGGVAPVTLNSTEAASFVINAQAGSTPIVTSNSITVPFINLPTQVSVKVRTTGTLLPGITIGGFKATVSAVPSSGLTIISDPNGVSPDVSATGAGAGSQIIVNSNNVAAVTLALINTGGINTGEFATLNYNVVAGNFPKASDFNVVLKGVVVDSNNAIVSGIGVEILSVTIQ